jgi:hypothetical protein
MLQFKYLNSNFLLLLCSMGVHYSIYKGSYNVSNTSHFLSANFIEKDTGILVRNQVIVLCFLRVPHCHLQQTSSKTAGTGDFKV